VEQAADRFDNLGPVKTLAGRRMVPIGPRLVLILKEWKLACPKGKLQLVFPTESGTVRTYSNVVNRWLYPLEASVGLGRLVPERDKAGHPKTATWRGREFVPIRADGNYTPHAFRHFAASLWIDQGATPKQVSKWIGHENVAFTMQVYAHLFDRAARARDHVTAAEETVLA
jgi:integrase